MLFLNPKQIQEIFDIIENYHSIFIYTNVGSDFLSTEDRLKLLSFGVDINNFNPQDIITHAFKFGMLSQALEKKVVKNFNYNQFLDFVQSGKFLPLTKSEELALQAVKQQCYGDIRGLQNKIKQTVNQTIITTSQKQKAKVKKQINQLAQTAISERQSIVKFSSELGHLTKDWARDFDRIADYIMHSAYQHGRAEQLLKTYGDDVEVYFTVYEKACKHCVRIYLTDDIGSEPKVFKLIDVMANGNNIGVKSIDWLASINPIHPWCRCTLTLKPKNSIWDANKNQFVITRNTHGVRRKSKVKVEVSYD